MKYPNQYIFFLLLLFGNILQAQPINCFNNTFYIKSLEMQDFGNQLNAIIQVPNPDNKNLEILVSEDGGFVYTTKTVTTVSFNLLLGLPKQELYFKVRYTNGTCVSETLPVGNIIPQASNKKYGQIDIEWNATGNQTVYELKRFGGLAFNKNGLTTTSFSDKKIECSGNYQYQIIGIYSDQNGNQTQVISHYARSNANYVSNPPPKNTLVATISSDGKPQLNILDTAGDMLYSIYRSVDGANFQKIIDTHDTQFTDTGDANQHQYCYYVNYIDACGHVSGNSSKACTIFLTNSGNTLNWNAPISTPTPISYEVIHLPNESLTIQVANNYTITSVSKNQEKYQITATLNFIIDGKSYVTKTISNPVTIDFASNTYFGNTFTPNEDGLNDIFEVKFEPTKVKDFQMWIYTNWGDIIFEGDETKNTWDGTYKGEKVNPGKYVLKVYFKDSFGTAHTKIEQLNLIR